MRLHLSIALLFAVLVSFGCGRTADTGRPAIVPPPPQTQPLPPATQPPPAPPPEERPATRLEADPAAVTLPPGATVQVKLRNIAPGTAVTVKADPPDAKVQASMDGDMLTIRADPDAQGTFTLHVNAGADGATPIVVTVR